MILNLNAPPVDNETDDILVKSANGDMGITSKAALIAEAGGNQNLQQVTNVGNLSTNPIIIYSVANASVKIDDDNIQFTKRVSGVDKITTVDFEPATTNHTLTIPAKNAPDTFAMLSDITAGGDFIPLSGTTEGNPVTGDISFEDVTTAGNLGFTSTYGDTVFSRYFSDNNWIEDKAENDTQSGTLLIQPGAIDYGVNTPIGNSSIGVSSTGVTVSADSATSKGITGVQDFTANITDLDYTQKKYVDYAIYGLVPYTGATSSVDLGSYSIVGYGIGIRDYIDESTQVHLNYDGTGDISSQILFLPPTGDTSQTIAYRSWVSEQIAAIPSGATNLTYTPSPTNGTVNSDTGTDATIPLGDNTNAGLIVNGGNAKLANVPSDTNSALALKANDNAVVHITGNENIAGNKTFTGDATFSTSGLTTFERLAPSNNNLFSGSVFRATTSSGSMTDNFGVLMSLAIQRSGGSSNTIAQLAGQRDGADNSGKIILRTTNAGTMNDRLVIDKDGKAVFTGTVEVPTPTLAQQAATKGYVDSMNVANDTTTSFTKATLNSTYPSAVAGFRVICKNIGSGMIYTKASGTDWLSTSAMLMT